MKNVYFIGIKGVGMTALAQVYQASGYSVTGSDVTDTFFTDAVLQDAGIPYSEGYSVENLPENIDLVVVSGAYYQEGKESKNPEVQEVLRRGLPLKTYSEALGELSKDYISIGVAGSHGKTSTSALLTYALESLDADPFAVIGSHVPQFGGNARIGGADAKYLVAESDEYQHHFLDFHPSAVMILNIDYDHPDFFPTVADYEQAFVEFIKKLPEDGVAVVCGDDPKVRSVIVDNSELSDTKVVTYGRAEDNDVRLIDERTVVVGDQSIGELELLLIGEHNLMNALGVVAVLIELGFDPSRAVTSMRGFTGMKRRMEYKGVTDAGTLIYDDYAHHPREVATTLAGMKQHFRDKTIHCAFQPHTYTRTAALLDEFATSFGAADKVYLFDIYGSARESQGGVSTQDLVDKVQELAPDTDVQYIKSFEDGVRIGKSLGPDDVFVTMGAGDVWTVGRDVLE